MKRKIEILAPAGSYESMKAAMNAGCDAVYIGGSSFGARAYANNLDEETLLRAIDETHIRDKRLYLTVNTLVKEQERIDMLYRYLEKFYLQGLDAVIVQDVGVMHFIHRNFPKLPIHASTQTTITMAQGANLLKNMGVTRLVTARELSLKEIKLIRENTDLEIETFVHGALCYCYSGQCLMSSLIGGRSGNRGRCAQPCRKPYRFYSGDNKISSEQEKYLISPRDINTVALIPELIAAGVDSFKIEGRMKRSEYAAAVAHTYRKYTDYYQEFGSEKYEALLHSKEYTRDMTELMDLYNRGGFSSGYGKTYHGKKMMSLSRPNHSGVFVGEVTGLLKGNQVSIHLKEDINAQDILEIRGAEDEAVYEFTVKDPHGKNEALKTNVGAKYSAIKPGNGVYRTKNNQLLERIAADYMEKDLKKGIQGILQAKHGKPLQLTLTFISSDGNKVSITAQHDLVQAALKQPMTKEKLAAPLEKLGDTLFFMEALEIEADENIFVPVAWLNELRRNAVCLLQEAIIGEYLRKPFKVQEYFAGQGENTGRFNKAEPFGICVNVQTFEQFEAALAFEEVTSIYADYDTLTMQTLTEMSVAANVAGKSFYLVLPHICRALVYEKLKRDIFSFIEDSVTAGFVVKNLEELALLQSLMEGREAEKEIILNHNMYVFNQEAKQFYNELGLYHYTAPLELNSQELKALGITDCDLMVYGYLPVMVSVQCLYESTDGCRKCKAGENRMDYMVDPLGKKFYVQTHCSSCYNTLYNGQSLSLLRYAPEIISLKPGNLRLDFTMEAKEETKAVLDAYINTFIYGKESTQETDQYTTGHYKRGVE